MAQDILMFVLTLIAFAYVYSAIFSVSVLSPEVVVLDGQPSSSSNVAETAIVQQQTRAKSKNKKEVTPDDENQMACDEVDCVKTCTHVSSSGEKVVNPSCRKNCAKVRCKKRCKLEPPLAPYVEREMKKEKCKDRCDAIKTNDEKCHTQCDNEAKPCTERCKERAKRYFCVRDLDLLPQEEDFDESQFENSDVPI